MATLDKATLDAVKATKREQHAALSHKRQLARNSARKRANLQIINARAAAQQNAVQQRAQAAGAIAAQREAIRTQHIVNPPQRSVSSQVRSRVTSGATNTVINTATPSSDSGLIMTTIFVIIGLALFYNVVTKADQFSGFVGSVGDFLHKLSSTSALFQVTTK